MLTVAWLPCFSPVLLGNKLMCKEMICIKLRYRASLVVQWLRVCSPELRNTGSVPGLGGSQVGGNWAWALQLLSQHLEPTSSNYWAHVLQLLKAQVTPIEPCGPIAILPQLSTTTESHLAACMTTCKQWSYFNWHNMDMYLCIANDYYENATSISFVLEILQSCSKSFYTWY